MRWSETTTCIDLTCECGAYFQYAADIAFAGSIRCVACEQVWILSSILEVRRAREGNPLDSYRIEAAEVPIGD